MWKKLAIRQEILRRMSLLTGGFTLISIGVGMRFGLWLGLVIGGVLAVVFQWHIDKDG